MKKPAGLVMRHRPRAVSRLLMGFVLLLAFSGAGLPEEKPEENAELERVEGSGGGIVSLLPPGDCTSAQHAALQAEVSSACAGPRACNGAQSCTELVLNRARNASCVAARQTINNTCFRGGDPGHRIAVEQARNAVRKCDTWIIRKGCDDCPWLPF